MSWKLKFLDFDFNCYTILFINVTYKCSSILFVSYYKPELMHRIDHLSCLQTVGTEESKQFGRGESKEVDGRKHLPQHPRTVS